MAEQDKHFNIYLTTLVGIQTNLDIINGIKNHPTAIKLTLIDGIFMICHDVRHQYLFYSYYTEISDTLQSYLNDGFIPHALIDVYGETDASRFKNLLLYKCPSCSELIESMLK